MPANRSTKAKEPTDGQEMGRILRFEPRQGPRSRRPQLSAPLFGRSPVEGLDKYARPPDDTEDYRHRMRANAAAIVVVALLIWCGYWLFETLAEMRRTQDCILSGRTNCARIDVSPQSR
jgi:hypothetical protein